MAKHGLEVVEGANAYYLYLFGKCVGCLGDGVDLLYDENDEPISPGTPEFLIALRADITANPHDYLDAYVRGK